MALISEKTEVAALQETEISLLLLDSSDNVVPNKPVSFEVLSGSGRLSQRSAIADSAGLAKVTFQAGTVTETNTIRAVVDSMVQLLDVVVNLTTSDLPDGVVVNYPNPFGVEYQTTKIDYYLAEDADVSIKIFDLFGNLVWSREIAAGNEGAKGRQNSMHPNSIEWAGVNDNGQQVGNGGYLLLAKASAEGKNIMNYKRKIVVLR
jgi:hypothetical protein